MTISVESADMSRIITSLRKNYKGISYILVSAMMLSLGQLIWKISAGDSLPLLIVGFGLYGIGALFMILAYRNGSFSTIHPMMSTSYVLAFFLGWLFLQESISEMMVAGLALVLAGNLLIGGGDA
jgi:drug/metabolite transporter (DMT)-like permease